MSVSLRTLRTEDMPATAAWREAARPYLRTPFAVTVEQQQDFYARTVCHRHAPHRYWAVVEDEQLVGIGGLTDIAWETGIAEISLVLNPDACGHGVGSEGCRLLLGEAFDAMRLETVTAEVYHHNPALSFWKKMAARYEADVVTLPRRKWWTGQLWGADYLSFSAMKWRGHVAEPS